jgi:hypothetical protein
MTPHISLVVALVALLATACGPREQHMRPAVAPPTTNLGAHVVRAVEASSALSAPSLRVITPDMLALVLRRALADAGAYGANGHYVLRARIVKLEGGASGIGFNRYALVVVDNRLVDDRDPAWTWQKQATRGAGMLPIPGTTYAGPDAQRDAFEAAVREVAGDTVRAVREVLEGRAADVHQGARSVDDTGAHSTAPKRHYGRDND